MAGLGAAAAPPFVGLLAWLLPGPAQGHGSIAIPAPRNSIDSTLPPWSHGKHPPSGAHVYKGNACICGNGTNECNSGQACFWFSQGCTIGCSKCDGNGTRLPNWDHCPGESIEATLNLPEYRTANRNATAGSIHDIWRYQPWRAPGKAPVFDPCGMAGGIWHQVPHGGGNGGDGGTFNATRFAKQGDLGSKVLKPRPTGTVWRRGNSELTAWYIVFNHGGGYRFRLCPANETLTEECFQRHELDFVGDMHTVRFRNGTGTQIPNTIVRGGGGVGWMMNPIPNPIGYTSTCEHSDGRPCDGCPCGTGYPGGAAERDFPYPLPGHNGDLTDETFRIEDRVRVPQELMPGNYVLGFRWDCETSSQVWSACADITIV